MQSKAKKTARAFIRLGLTAVLPIAPLGKNPQETGWTKKHKTVAQIDALPDDCNIGFHPGPHNMCVLDLDFYGDNKQHIKKTLKKFGVKNEHLKTWCTSTPSGGRHYYYSCQDTRSAASSGIEFRSQGLQVVIPGSVGRSKVDRSLDRYRWIRSPSDVPLLTMPLELENLRTHLKSKPKDKTTANVGGKVLESGRNNYLKAEAVKLAQSALPTEERIKRLEALDVQNCVPPLSLDSPTEFDNLCEFMNTAGVSVSHIYVGGLKFVHVDKYQEPKRTSLPTLADLWDKKYEKPKWAINGLLPASGTHILLGQAKSAKSFILLEAVRAISTCTDFAGKLEAPEKKRVLLMSYEGEEQLAVERMRALALARKDSKDEFASVTLWAATPENPHMPGFYNDEDFDKIKKFVSELKVKPEVIIIDPLYKAAAGADENSSSEMNIVMSRIREIGVMTGAAIWISHHCGKNLAAGARGSTVIVGEADSTIYIEKTAEEETRVSFSVTTHASRRGSIRPFRMRLETDGAELTRAKFIFEEYDEATGYKEQSIITALLENGGSLRRCKLLEHAKLDDNISTQRMIQKLETNKIVTIKKGEAGGRKEVLISLSKEYVNRTKKETPPERKE